MPVEHLLLVTLALVPVFGSFLVPEDGTWRRIHRVFRRRGRGIKIGKIFLGDEARVRHTHIVGATGSGKTVLLEQIILADIRRGQGCGIIDPKGDRSFYLRLRHEMEKAGRLDKLFFLSAEFADESDFWNPCALGDASELQSKFYNANIYHEPFYAKASELGLLESCNELHAAKTDKPITLIDLQKTLKRVSTTRKNQVMEGLLLDFSSLLESEWKHVLLPSPDRREIQLDRIVEENGVIYIDLPTEAKKVQSARVGRLLTQELMLISGRRKRRTDLKEAPYFSVYVDEFDAFATPSFSTFLNKARSSKMMIHICHQTLSDLKLISHEFMGQILGNCSERFIFRQDDPDDAELWARVIGTKNTLKSTYRTSAGIRTGEASLRDTRSFIYSPDTIKDLKTGQCITVSKSSRSTAINTIPAQRGVQYPPFKQPFIAERVKQNLASEKKDKWSSLNS